MTLEMDTAKGQPLAHLNPADVNRKMFTDSLLSIHQLNGPLSRESKLTPNLGKPHSKLISKATIWKGKHLSCGVGWPISQAGARAPGSPAEAERRCSHPSRSMLSSVLFVRAFAHSTSDGHPPAGPRSLQRGTAAGSRGQQGPSSREAPAPLQGRRPARRTECGRRVTSLRTAGKHERASASTG